MKSDKIVEKAREWIGTPFHEQSRQKMIGCDCIGFIVGVASELGINSLANQPWGACSNIWYDTAEDSYLLVELMPKHFQVVQGEIVVGNLLLIKLSESQYHVALVTSSNPLKIIHSCSSLGSVCEHKLPFTWKQKIVLQMSLK